MIPDFSVLVPFVLIVAVAVYFHTVTGFGLAMIIMAAASGLGVASVAALASIISLATLVNSGVALRGSLHHIDWQVARSLVLGVLPASVMGVIVLEYLSGAAANLLQLLLGVVIMCGGLNFAWRPAPLRRVSSRASFIFFGFLGGLTGGMFAIPGPPLIFQLYRQPMTLPQICSILILMNAVIAAARSAFVGLQGQLTADILILSALCIPVVALATAAGRRYPPPFSTQTMRRIAFSVLVLMGIGLVIPALPLGL